MAQTNNARGDGTWIKLPSGMWQNKISYNNILKKFSGKTKDEIRQKRKEWITSIDKANGTIVILSTKSLSEYMEEWVKVHIRSSRSRQTGDTYESTIKRIKNHDIAKSPISTLTATELQIYINSLAFNEPYYAKETVDKTYNHINACLRFAVKNKDLHSNPMDIVQKIPQRNFPEKSQPALYTIFDDNDMSKIVIEAETKRGQTNKYSYGQHIVFLMYTGLRIGEALALQWQDYNSSTNILKINKSLSSVKSLNPNAKKKTELIIEEPKTSSSNREILLFDVAYNALMKIKEQCVNTSDTGYIFQTSTGEKQGRRNINRCLEVLQINAKVEHKGLSLHDLRHTFCSFCSRKGMQAKVLQEYVGHSDISITNKYYIHTTSEQIKNNIQMMNNQIKSNKS